jgi:hypothetical protein
MFLVLHLPPPHAIQPQATSLQRNGGVNLCRPVEEIALDLEGKTLKAILQVRQNPSTRTPFNQVARGRMLAIKQLERESKREKRKRIADLTNDDPLQNAIKKVLKNSKKAKKVAFNRETGQITKSEE